VCVCLSLSKGPQNRDGRDSGRRWGLSHSILPSLIRSSSRSPESTIDTQTILLKLPPIPKPRTQARGMYVCRIVILNLLLRFSAAKSSPFGVSRFKKVTVHLSGRSLQQREISFLSNPQFHQVPKQQQQQQQPHTLSSSLPPLIMRLHKFRSDK
jgi:hypothetical protein